MHEKDSTENISSMITKNWIEKEKSGKYGYKWSFIRLILKSFKWEL